MIVSNTEHAGEPVSFQVDGLTIRGRLHMPEADRPPFVVGSHGLFSTGDSPKQIALARELAAAGIAFFRFDHRGCGSSDGDFRKDTSLASRVKDLFTAIETLHRRTDLSGRFGLFGSSFGGTVGICVAAEGDPSALVVNAAPVRSRSLSESAVLADGPSELDASFYENLQFDVSTRLSGLRAVCVFHGDADRIVPVQSGREIHEKAREPKEIVVFQNGDHLMSRREDQVQFVRKSGEWFYRHLSPDINERE